MYFPGGVMPSFNITKINISLSKLNISYITHYNQIYLFEYRNPVGLFYSPNSFIIANQSDIGAYLTSPNYSANNEVIITPNNSIYNISFSQLYLLKSVKNDLHKAEIYHIKQISWDDFCLNVNATGPFLLVFTQTFSPYWDIYVNGTKLPEEYHFVAYGFANAWLINKTGILKIEVKIAYKGYVEMLYIKYFTASVLVLFLSYISYYVYSRFKSKLGV